MEADVAWGQIQGDRQSQQDMVACLAWANGLHLLVLADGIGGYVGGEVASKTVVESFRDEFIKASDLDARDRMLNALQASNYALFDRVDAEPELAGMGTTLLAAVLEKNALSWVSVGDCSIFLVRDDEIRRLNTIHSVGAMLDERAEAGQLSAQEAASAPDRSHLLEAVFGEDISLVDAPSDRFDLLPTDRLLLASDGVETCSRDVLCRIARADDRDSSEIVDEILHAVEGTAKPGQDNATIIVVQMVAGNVGV